MGAWVDRVPKTSPDGFKRRRAVFLGHLVPRQGVSRLIDAAERLGDDVAVHVIGTGPLEAELRERAPSAVTFHGYLDDHREVERLLRESAVAVAPYSRSKDTFTRYADPGKLKAYLAAGLPIVLTDVPPNARELQQEAGAEVVADNAEALAAGILRALASPDAWQARRESALAYARRFDWTKLFDGLFADLGLSPTAS
jgi:glycosyltransferase involved in cell wall biosynthesis